MPIFFSNLYNFRLREDDEADAGIPINPKKPRLANRAEEIAYVVEKFDIPQPQQILAQLYEMVDIPNKGQGCRATVNIAPGTCILDEPSDFTLTRPFTPQQISDTYNRLQLTEKADFDNLAGGPSQDGIFAKNSMELREQFSNAPKNRREGINFKASRFNHSCLPNAHLMWNQREEHFRIYALDDIMVGDEICVNYVRAEYTCSCFRQVELQDHNFTGTCSACMKDTKFGKESFARRGLMQRLHQEIEAITAGSFHDPLDLTTYRQCTERFLDLLVEEGLCGLPHADMYLNLSFWFEEECRRKKRHLEKGVSISAAMKAKDKALYNAREALGCCMVSTGEDSIATDRAVDRVLKLRKLPTR